MGGRGPGGSLATRNRKPRRMDGLSRKTLLRDGKDPAEVTTTQTDDRQRRGSYVCKYIVV